MDSNTQNPSLDFMENLDWDTLLCGLSGDAVIARLDAEVRTEAECAIDSPQVGVLPVGGLDTIGSEPQVQEEFHWLSQSSLDLDSPTMDPAQSFDLLVSMTTANNTGTKATSLTEELNCAAVTVKREGSMTGQEEQDWDNVLSPAPSTVPSTIGIDWSDHQAQPDHDQVLTDHELVTLPVRDLNRRMKVMNREQRAYLKQKRRTLKNRGYAQNCRNKRISQKGDLEKENIGLQEEVRQLTQQVTRVSRERDVYRRQLELLRTRPHSESSFGPSSPDDAFL